MVRSRYLNDEVHEALKDARECIEVTRSWNWAWYYLLKGVIIALSDIAGAIREHYKEY